MVRPDRSFVAFAEVSGDNTKLTLKKIDNDTFIDELNTLKTVQCVLTLAYPAGHKLPPEVDAGAGSGKGVFFVSTESDLKDKLSTSITLD